MKYQIDRVNNEQQQSMTSGQTPTPWSPQAQQEQQQTKTPTPWINDYNIVPRYWESASDGQRVYNDVVRKEGHFVPENQNIFDYAKSAIQGGMNLVSNFSDMRKMNVTDKYKHAMMNCNAAQYGQGGADVATLASNLREWNDKRTGSNTIDSSEGDQYANKIGRLLGGKYPKEDCDELIQRYIKKNW